MDCYTDQTVTIHYNNQNAVLIVYEILKYNKCKKLKWFYTYMSLNMFVNCLQAKAFSSKYSTPSKPIWSKNSNNDSVTYIIPLSQV